MKRSTKASTHTVFSDAFGSRLKELREGRNLRQIDMAKLCGVAVASYANWEQGRALPSLNQMPILAGTLEVSSDYMMGIPKYENTEALAARLACLSDERQRIIGDLIDDMMEHCGE